MMRHTYIDDTDRTPRAPSHRSIAIPEASKSNEPCMPEEGDENYDRPRMTDSVEKNADTSTRSPISSCLPTWFDVFEHADVVRAGNHTELILSTIAVAAATITSVFGWAGILSNNRSLHSYYTSFLWICFGLPVAPGYLTYK